MMQKLNDLSLTLKKSHSHHLGKFTPKIPKWFCQDTSSAARKFNLVPHKDSQVDEEKSEERQD